MFFLKILHGFYNKFVNFQMILAYISKIQKINYFVLLIRGIINLYVRNTPNIK